MIDKELLLSEADPLAVAEYLGMEIIRKGSYDFISCPGHEKRLGKPDENIGNCYLTSRGYHCCACGVSKDVIDMTMEYMDCSFGKALAVIADACGGTELFENDSTQVVKRNENTLSSLELKLIGLNSSHKEMPIINASDREEIEEKKYCKQNGNEFIMYSNEQNNFLMDLYQNNNEEYKTLIKRKAKEYMDKYKKALDLYCKRDSPGAQKIFQILSVDDTLSNEDLFGIKNSLQKKYLKVKEIYDKYNE